MVVRTCDTSSSGVEVGESRGQFGQFSETLSQNNGGMGQGSKSKAFYV